MGDRCSGGRLMSVDQEKVSCEVRRTRWEERSRRSGRTQQSQLSSDLCTARLSYELLGALASGFSF